MERLLYSLLLINNNFLSEKNNSDPFNIFSDTKDSNISYHEKSCQNPEIEK